jgi:hypothetical protein
MAGCALALAAFPRSAPLGARVGRAALYLGASGLALLGGCLLLAPYLDVRGFFVDVFLTGSEPKGGPALAFENLESYGRELLGLLTPASLAAVAALVVGTLLCARRSEAAGGDGSKAQLWWTLPVSVAALAAAGAGFAASAAFTKVPLLFPLGFTAVARLGFLPKHLLSVGLLLSLVLPALCLRRSAQPGRREILALAVLALLAFPAAIMHSLSAPSFRWTYDNNPLIVVALGALCLLGLRTAQLLLPKRRRSFAVVMTAAAAMLQFTLWATSTHTIRRLEQCAVSWPEVDYLRGARLPRAAEPLRELVPLVRRLAPAPNDEVLVLPNDPDLEAWFDRRRPQLSSAIIFVDQYWDRYVDADFERVASHPPKVILLAPRNRGPYIQALWGAHDTRSRRFMMRVIWELVPHYEHVAALEVGSSIKADSRGEDFVDVWVRKEGRPLRGRPAPP